MVTIDKPVIKEAVDNNGFVSVITVINFERIHPGTRGEMALITASVDHQLHGMLQTHVEITRYWNSQQEDLQQGTKYIVVLQNVIKSPRLWLAGYQQLDCDDCSDIIDAYNIIIQAK